jgi:hypothetical protein
MKQLTAMQTERRLLLSYELRTTGAQKLRRSVRQILKKAA